jgi:hypothetical protein
VKKLGALSWCLFLALFFFAGIPDDGRCASQADKEGPTTINRSFMPTPEELQKWHALKDVGGPTFSGSPSWQAYMTFLENGFREHGLVDITKDRFTYTRWFTSDDQKDGQWSLSVDRKKIPVASYWAYSGSTDSQGVTAPLTYYDPKKPPATIEGKIVIFEIPVLPDPLPPMFQAAGFEFASDPDTRSTNRFTLDQWYQSNYVTRFSGFGEILTSGKAAGGLVILDMGPQRAAGMYTFPLTSPSDLGIPGLYLDRAAGASVKEAAAKGSQATLKLVAHKEKAQAFLLSGYLPGRNYGKEDDEVVLLASHTDGPNISQENGALGILGVIKYFSRIAQKERARTLLVLLDPQHYMPGGHHVDWYELHPRAASKIVASTGIEHLGQREYIEKGGDFLPSGEPEQTLIFVQDNDALIKLVIKAVRDNGLPRTLVQCPPRGGQGMWYGMGEVAVKRKIPGCAISANMSAYWSTEARIEAFDKDLCWKQIAVGVQLTGELMKADLKEIAVPQ